MASYLACLVIQRFILPILLTTCCFLRPVALSLPYLLFLFLLPFVPIATPKSIKGRTGYFLKILIVFSVLLCLIQIAFQILLAVLGNDFIPKCEIFEILFRHIGLIRLDNLDALSIARWIAPEIIMLVGSILIFVLLKRSCRELAPLTDINVSSPDGAETNPQPEPPVIDLDTHGIVGPEQWKLAVNIGKVLSLIALCVTGAIQPSVPSFLYFAVFMGAATWWGCNKELELAFAIVLRICIAFLAIHVTSFLAYQNPWPQEFLEPNSTIPRILGFSAIYSSACSNNLTDGADIRQIVFNDNLELDHYLNPIALIICYFTISITSSVLLKPQPEEKKSTGGPFSQLENGVQKMQRQVSFRMQRKNILRKTLTSDKWRGAARKVKGIVVQLITRREPSTPNENEPNERTPLMRGGTRKVADSKPDISSTSHPPDGDDAIPMNYLGKRNIIAEDDDDNSTGFFEQIAMATSMIAKYIYKNSYIFTNVVMMAWSIVYHSWIGFVLLLWANLIWIIPDQRKNMLRSSPFLVFYAEFFLVATFLYGMNLTDDELPSNININGINLPQIGFIKYTSYPIGPILLKSIFTIMFLASLRQMLQERQEERQKSALSDFVAPLQLTVSAATANLPKKPEQKESMFIKKAGKLIDDFLIQYWIYVVAITLFICGITGQQMTGFRILYMALFLVFVLTFQFSYDVWRNFMYYFWLLVIVYSMAILVLVYTYQFDKFNIYWDEYLYISEQLQHDIGMEKYETKQLFLHLLTPTMIVVITVIQLHYCHEKFLKLSAIPNINGEGNASNPSSIVYGTFIQDKPPDDDDEETEPTDTLGDIRIRKLSKQEIKGFATKMIKRAKEWVEIALLFLEIHFYKILLLSAFYLGVREVELLHTGFIFLAVVGIRSRPEVQTLLTRVASLIASLLWIFTMMYQVDYIDQNKYESNCTNETTENEVTNNAIWVGFKKENDKLKLSDLIKPYLIYIFIVTLHAILVLRQTIKRIKMGQTPQTPSVVFKKIRRADADKDIPHLIKYLVNYGFYKFGIEICLVVLVTVIGYRMDLVACFYSAWLCCLFFLPRNRLSKLWGYTIMFIMFSIPIQYISLLGLPPGLCIEYPWKDVEILQDFNIWAMLPENTIEFKHKSRILLADFLLLILMCRQLLVFRLEFRYNNSPLAYPGGSNESVLDDIDQLGQVPFENPTHDFVAKIRNYLDVMKRFVFLIFFWFTLAIVFLTGTNRVNLLSLGYIIGSFTFLWQGTDFYLRPIYTIMKWWNYLIAYNVTVVTIKTMVQLLGCLFLESLKSSNCWLVQMFGITCICSAKHSAGNPSQIGTKTCLVPLEDAGLFWDGVCFAFLIIQRRMFSSHYFCHIINETKASLILASRGNELIEELRKKEMKIEAERERMILEKIKAKMERIKATNQRILEENEPKHHAADLEGSAPLARSHSLSSGIGYHTPIEDDDEDEDPGESMFVEGEGVSEIPTDLPGISPRAGSFLNTQAPSPSSAIMTVSLDAYLDPHKISYGSPGESELVPRIASPDDTFPVFSPPPFDEPDRQINQNMLVPPAPNGGTSSSGSSNIQPVTRRQHRRQSSLNTVSWPNQNELTVNPPPPRRLSISPQAATASGDEQDQDKSQMSTRGRPISRRKSSVGTSVAQDDLTMDQSRHRTNYLPSWAFDDDDDDCITTTRISRRKFSWGPIGEHGLRDSIRSASSRSPVSHHESIRSGDYYMFQDIEDEFDLDIFGQRDSDDEEEKRSSARRRLSKKMTVGQLLTKMKEDTEKERIEQIEQEEIEKEKRLSGRRKSSPVLRQHQQEKDDSVRQRTTVSEPIPHHTQFDPPSSSIGIDDEVTEGIIQPDGQQPSTSRKRKDDEDPSIFEDKTKGVKDKDSDDEEPETEAAKKRKILIEKIMMVPTFLSSLLVSLTLKLHRFSRSYRYVMRVLAEEKDALKKSPGFGVGVRSGPNMIWTPIQHSKTARDSLDVDEFGMLGNNECNIIISRHDSKSSLSSSSSCKAQADSQTQSKYLDDRTDRYDESILSSSPAMRFDNTDGLTPFGGIGAALAMMKRESQQPKDEDVIRRTSVVPEIRILAPSLEQGLDDYSRTGPFEVVHDDSLASKTKDVLVKIDDKSEDDEEDFSTKDHHILVELLSALWYVILSHTDFICYTMVFINQIQSASILSLPLPLIVLLWGTLTFPRPSKTFWVTVIAYTQTVVLIKCLSQFEVLPWNQKPITDNDPFAAARILGIERKKGYATYDLILLLVVFCHRIILKSLGLWKSEMPSAVDEEEQPEEVIKEKVEPEKIEKPVETPNNQLLAIVEKIKTVSIVEEKEEEEIVEPPTPIELPEFVIALKISFVKYSSSAKQFFQQLFDRESRKTADVYGFLFLCDFINFFVILFGFSAFGTQEGDGGVLSYFEENKVPITFLLMLVIQFFFIVVDRGLYLRKNMTGKILFQFILIVGLHIWMFFVLPATTERSFNASRPPVMYYLIKCYYLLFSAYQIRCGYPLRILGNFLTKGFTMLNFAGFKVYINIPFLMELRTLMDWMWTETSMTLFDWLKMEDIFQNVYQLKCSRQLESDLPAPRGQKKGAMVKYLMGGGMILGIITVIWFPLALFAFSNTVGEPNLPYDVSISLRIGPYEPVYVMSAQDSDIFGLSEADWDNFMKPYEKDKSALTFLSNYEHVDVAAVRLGANSTTIWNISPPDRDRLLEDLSANSTLTCRFRYKISRESRSKENPGIVEKEKTYVLGAADQSQKLIRTSLVKMLRGEDDRNTSAIIPFMLPKFLKVKNSGDLNPAHQLLPNVVADDDEGNYQNLTLHLYESDTLSNITMPLYWWETMEICDPINFVFKLPYSDCAKYITLYLFNDKIFPSTISSIAAGGIVGLYTSLIFLFSRFLRSTIFQGGSSKIMFEDLPNVDRVLQLCLDIYLVRESQEFTLEEDLFAKLIFLYRSPETMIKWTRPKNEKGEDDTSSVATSTNKKND